MSAVAAVFLICEAARQFNTAYRMADDSQRPRRQPFCSYQARGRLETRKSKIAAHYKMWFAFDVIVIVSVGVDIYTMISGEVTPVSALRAVRILRVAKIGQDAAPLWAALCSRSAPATSYNFA